MSELPPKKEREENIKWVKWSVIFSGIAVLGTIFSGWMAYNASVSSAQISGKMNKENELETRIYQQRYDLYKEIGDALYDFRKKDNKLKAIDKANILQNKLFELGYQIRVIGSPEVICRYNDLLIMLENYFYRVDESKSDKFQMEFYAPENYDYWGDLIPRIFYLERAIRLNLLGSKDVDLTLHQSHETENGFDFAGICSNLQDIEISEQQYAP